MKTLLFTMLGLLLTLGDIEWRQSQYLPTLQTLAAHAFDRGGGGGGRGGGGNWGGGGRGGDWSAARPGAGYGEARRVARRTSRRTSRRWAYGTYYSYLPSGCYWLSPYYNCAGVYYEPVVEDGTTVYVVVQN